MELFSPECVGGGGCVQTVSQVFLRYGHLSNHRVLPSCAVFGNGLSRLKKAAKRKHTQLFFLGKDSVWSLKISWGKSGL